MAKFSMPIKLDTETLLMAYARPYGVKGINFGGCVAGQAKGFQGAMRRSGHAHYSRKSYIDGLRRWRPEDLKWVGWICCKSSHPEKFLTKDGKPNQFFWHEVGHIYRPSWTQGQCDKFGWQMVRNQ